eukprot:COSAG01_NODE_52295_length_347_cov_1.483871_1_plen_47_part_01
MMMGGVLAEWLQRARGFRRQRQRRRGLVQVCVWKQAVQAAAASPRRR